MTGGTEKGPLRLRGGGVPDYPSSGLQTKKEISCA